MMRRTIRYGLVALPAPVRSRMEPGLLRSYETYIRLRSAPADDNGVGPDGLPVPSAKLRVLVSGTADRDYFTDTGRRQAEFFRSILAGNRVSLAAGDAVLDFGCGCGRIARWFADPQGPALFGCDPNRELVTWCRANLGFMNAAVSEPRPPLPYPDATFDFVYAISIFTHLPEMVAGEWMAELARIIKPGGHLLFTTAGEAYRDRLSGAEAKRYDSGHLIVQFDTAAGTNLCIVYHPPAYVRSTMIGGFELVQEFLTPEHPLQAEQARLAQDTYLVQRSG